MIEASSVLPGRSLNMYRPMNNAMGMVQAIVNVPQEEPGTTRTASLGSGQENGPLGFRLIRVEALAVLIRNEPVKAVVDVLLFQVN